jgi:tubulin beta
LRELVQIQAGQCGSQMSTNFLEVFCDEQGIGGDGVYYGGNDTQLGRINVFSEASGALRPRAWLDRRRARVATRRDFLPG